MKEFMTINRMAVVVKLNQVFYDWANRVDPDNPVREGVIREGTVYLIPEFDDISQAEKYIQKNYRDIFNNELNSWYTDESLWPRSRTYTMFREWITLEICEMIFDTINKPIAKD